MLDLKIREALLEGAEKYLGNIKPNTEEDIYARKVRAYAERLPDPKLKLLLAAVFHSANIYSKKIDGLITCVREKLEQKNALGPNTADLIQGDLRFHKKHLGLSPSMQGDTSFEKFIGSFFGGFLKMRNRMFRMRFDQYNSLGLTPEEQRSVKTISAHLFDGSKTCSIRIFNSAAENSDLEHSDREVISLTFFSACASIQSLTADQINLTSLVDDINIPLEVASEVVEINENHCNKFL